jgi:hypothetical protein
MLYSEVTAVCYAIYIKHRNTVWEEQRIVEFELVVRHVIVRL